MVVHPWKTTALLRVLLLLTACAFATPQIHAQESQQSSISFTSPSEDQLLDEQGYVSKEGKVTLQWEAGEASSDATYELQQAEAESFENPWKRYEGPDRGSVITGLREGTYFYRVRMSGEDQWSEPLKVTVKYHDMWLVWLLMGTGAVVFVLTVGLVVGGHFRQEHDSEASS